MSDTEQNVMPTTIISVALVEATASLTSQLLASNSISKSELQETITSVYRTLASCAGAGTEGTFAIAQASPIQEPAVDVKESVFPDYIVCLEDGKHLTMLKRHLASSYNMTPDEYRAKWGLPSNYPMIAPNYSELRSQLAKEMGLGRKPAERARRGKAKSRIKGTVQASVRRSANGSGASAR